jgi:hypothetical protein
MLLEAVAPTIGTRHAAPPDIDSNVDGGSSGGESGSVGSSGGSGNGGGGGGSSVVDKYRPPQRPWLRPSSKPRREAATWLLAVVSVQSQRARGFRLPLYLQLPLLPLLGIEALLRRLANKLTSDSFPALQRSRKD